jgi:hypothetical protein
MVKFRASLLIFWRAVVAEEDRQAGRQTGRHTFYYYFFSSGATSPSGPGLPHCWGSRPTLRHTTLDRTPLDEWSARPRGFYLTTHNTHKRKTFMPSAGFEPTIPARERPQTHALDTAATGIGNKCVSESLGFVYCGAKMNVLIGQNGCGRNIFPNQPLDADINSGCSLQSAGI